MEKVAIRDIGGLALQSWVWVLIATLALLNIVGWSVVGLTEVVRYYL